MINVNEKLLDILTDSQYFLLCKMVKYGKQSCPKNEVLCKATKWGLKKVLKVKKELVNEGVLKIETRWKIVNDKKVRDSNKYIITTSLIAKYRPIKQTGDISLSELVQSELSQSELVKFDIGHNDLDYIKVLRIVIIESNKLLKIKESIENTHTQIQDLESANQNQKAHIEKLEEELKNKKENPKEKGSEQKEKEYSLDSPSIVPPTAEHDNGAKLKPVKKRDRKNWTSLDMNLHSLTLPKEWPIELQEKVLEYWYYMEEKKGVNWGTVATIKRQRDAVTDYLKKFSDVQIIDSLEEAMKQGNASYNPKWTINRKKKNGEDHGEKGTFSFKTKITNG